MSSRMNSAAMFRTGPSSVVVVRALNLARNGVGRQSRASYRASYVVFLTKLSWSLPQSQRRAWIPSRSGVTL